MLEADHAAAGICHPQGAVRFGEDAFGSVQVVAEVAQRVSVNVEIQNRIRADGLGSSHPRLPLSPMSSTRAHNITHVLALVRTARSDCRPGPRPESGLRPDRFPFHCGSE